MPQTPLNLDSLRTLLRMPTTSRVQDTDGFVARRRNDIVSGVDDLVPDADGADIRMAQQDAGRKGYGGISRDMIKQDTISKVKNLLGMGEIEHGREMEQDEHRERLRGEYDLRGREISNEGQRDVARTYADQRYNQALAVNESKQQQIDAMLRGAPQDRSVSVAGVGSVGAPPRQGATRTSATTVPDQMDKRYQTAKTTYDGGWNSLVRKLPGGFDGGRQGYETALTSVLERKGTLQNVLQGIKSGMAEGLSADELIQDAEANGFPLGPHEQEYIRLKVGR